MLQVQAEGHDGEAGEEEVTRGTTLVEKKYGRGIRPGLMRSYRAPWDGCCIEGCSTRPEGSIEIYVDAHPPTALREDYYKLLRKLPAQAWVEVKACVPHLTYIVQSSEEVLESADTWEPGAVSPFVLPRPPKVVV